MAEQGTSLKINVLISELKSLAVLKKLIKSKLPAAEIVEKFDFEADLIIIDDRSFANYQNEIKKLKAASDNFIPLLLLKQQNTRLNKVIHQYLEDIIEIPVSKNMLSLKIDNLLNIRSYWLKKDSLEKKYYKIFDNISDLIFLFKADKETLELEESCEINQQTLDTLAYGRQEFEALTLKEIQSKIFKERDFKEIINRIKKKEELKIETALTDSRGESITVELKVQKIEEANQNLLLFLCRDISEEKKKEEEIKYLLFHDELTGIYNRRFFEEELQRLDSRRQLPLTIIMIDVNGLKLINDNYGHQIGDLLLQRTAENLKLSVREEDIVARFGGDEFAVLLPQTSAAKAKAIADRIRNQCSQTNIAGQPISLGIGYAAKVKVEENINEIFKLADDRMYIDKKQCKKTNKG
jgi:diguanylate cyclase (GGDEF)-like protein/PAS domain S-box-containing protein